ncbi:acyltransferase domain-containing protein, partial [Streptomyces sp. NPDC088789]|uniref:acyltransferase domain-containing protein n=1 Tax=Streptomyces sp. NPDC088789 TaxID=3365899 RepID=UPI003800A143
ALTLPDAIAVVTLRAQALRQLAGTGTMASFPLPADALTELPDGVHLAAVNGPATTILAGDTTTLTTLVESHQQRGIRARLISVDYASHTPAVEALRETILTDLTERARIQPTTPTIPFYSTHTGGLLPEDRPLDATYWIDNLRHPVHFHETALKLLDDGHHTVIETSPHPVLAAALNDTLTAHPSDTHHHPTLTRHHDTTARLLTTLTTLHTHHHTIDLSQHLPTTPLQDTDLPTYPFQHQPYWLHTPTQLTNANDLGLNTTEHPLLSTATHLADSNSTVLSGRIGLKTHPWLADHAVAGTVLLPGTALVDLALHAGDHTSTTHLEELTLHTPLILDDTTTRDLQITTTPNADSWHITIHSRPHTDERDSSDSEWTCHATGTLTTTDEPTQPLTQWPPTGATRVEISDLYEHLAEAGYEYGPTFQGVTAVWTQPNGTLHAEVTLPEDTDPTGHTIHPALLDAALHPLATTNGTQSDVRLPFAWTGVTIHATGATHLRVTLTTTENDITVRAWDPTGAPVATVNTLATRPIDPTTLHKTPDTNTRNSLFHLTWKPVEASGEGVDEDEFDIYTAPVDLDDQNPAAAHAATEALLTHLQQWLSTNEDTERRLVILTQKAVATSPAEDIHLAHAPLWGLARSAQNENPDRIHLIDTDDPTDTSRITQALITREPQLAYRRGEFLVPRLARSEGDSALDLPAETWKLAAGAAGTIEAVTYEATPEWDAPLAEGQVRVDVRAIGLNFRDTLIALGMYPGDAPLGSEGAGIVTEVADDVSNVTVGDRVMGVFIHGVGAQTVTDHRLITTIPDDWSFTTAAGVPVAFLTAYYALYDLADLQPGETLLIHAATGGVGSA